MLPQTLSAQNAPHRIHTSNLCLGIWQTLTVRSPTIQLPTVRDAAALMLTPFFILLMIWVTSDYYFVVSSLQQLVWCALMYCVRSNSWSNKRNSTAYEPVVRGCISRHTSSPRMDTLVALKPESTKFDKYEIAKVILSLRMNNSFTLTDTFSLSRCIFAILSSQLQSSSSLQQKRSMMSAPISQPMSVCSV